MIDGRKEVSKIKSITASISLHRENASISNSTHLKAIDGQNVPTVGMKVIYL